MHRTRYLIGLLTLGLCLLGTWFLWHLLSRAEERPGLGLHIEFRDARGLRPGGDVRYRGVTVGAVRAVEVAGDGSKAVVDVLLEPAGAAQACVNSTFWIVSPRFSGITSGATGLDTLVRDAYVTFLTPEERGSALLPGSLIGGAERPPTALEPESLEPLAHGDLLMSLLVPENHGLRAGSPVVFRGMTTGDVRGVALARDGSHVEVQLRIQNRHRLTVTDRSSFWVARPYVSGALLSGFTVSDVNALLSPFVSYYTEPGVGLAVADGYRVAAATARPESDNGEVPPAALQQAPAVDAAPRDPLVLVRVTYAAIDRDTWSADDRIANEGTGVLWLDGAGRAVVLTARSLVDGNYTEQDTFGAAPDIEQEEIKVVFARGPVLRAHRLWVAPDGRDLAALVLDEAPPDLVGTPGAMLGFDDEPTGAIAVRAVQRDAMPLPPIAVELPQPLPALDANRGGAIVHGDRIAAIVGQRDGHTADAAVAIRIDAVPTDLRPR